MQTKQLRVAGTLAPGETRAKRRLFPVTGGGGGGGKHDGAAQLISTGKPSIALDLTPVRLLARHWLISAQVDVKGNFGFAYNWRSCLFLIGTNARAIPIGPPALCGLTGAGASQMASGVGGNFEQKRPRRDELRERVKVHR